MFEGTMNKTIFIVLVSLFILSDAGGMLLCEKITYTSPSSCSSYTNNFSVESNTVSGCSGGGSTVTTFDVSGACSANVYSGSFGAIETPTGLVSAPNATGSQQYCYCQIKSINLLAVAPSARWVFRSVLGSASSCAYVCALACAYDARHNSGFRSALFSAVE